MSKYYFESSKKLNMTIKNSKLYIYKNYSHGVYEQAKDFNNKILKFFKEEGIKP